MGFEQCKSEHHALGGREVDIEEEQSFMMLRLRMCPTNAEHNRDESPEAHVPPPAV